MKGKEIEFKFKIKVENVSAIEKLIPGHYFPQQYLYNVYFDTPDLWLCQQHYALRLRFNGREWTQSFKGHNLVNDEGLHQREEWEADIAEEPKAINFYDAGKNNHTEKIADFDEMPVLNVTLFPAHVQKLLNLVMDKVIPLFTVCFFRKIWMHSLEDGTLLEIAIDQGEIKAKSFSESFCELELEIKTGILGDALKKFIAELRETGMIEPEKKSKAERGYLIYQKSIGEK